VGTAASAVYEYGMLTDPCRFEPRALECPGDFDDTGLIGQSALSKAVPTDLHCGTSVCSRACSDPRRDDFGISTESW
jgi:hypothetical protein